MTSLAPHLAPLALAPQRAMFALEFVDPIRGEPVAHRLRVTAEGLRPPTVTPSNRFVWLERGDPVDRRIRIQAISTDGMFAPFDDIVHVPAHLSGVPAARLILKRRLRPTGLYEPPPGMTAIGGMLVEGGGSPRPVAGAKVRIQFRYAEGEEVFTGCSAFTDARGGFTAVVGRLGDVKPDPTTPGVFEAWLRLKRGGKARSSRPLPVRLGRLTRIAAPLEWAKLARQGSGEEQFFEE